MTIQEALRRYRGAKLKTVGRRQWWVGRISQAEAARRTGISRANWLNWDSKRKVSCSSCAS